MSNPSAKSGNNHKQLEFRDKEALQKLADKWSVTLKEIEDGMNETGTTSKKELKKYLRSKGSLSFGLNSFTWALRNPSTILKSLR